MKAWTIWITGLPGSGKSTLSHALLIKLKEKRIQVQSLATDDLRKVMTPKPTYSGEERENVYSTIVFIAKLLNQNGVNTIIDGTGNLRQYRDVARKSLENFAIVYVKCPLKICIEREQKRGRTFGAPTQIYEKGLKGKNTTVPGLNVPYEEPLDAGIVINTEEQSIKENVNRIYNFILNTLENKKSDNEKQSVSR